MMVEVGDPGVEAQECLSAFPSFEALLTSLLSPCGSVFLLNDVIAAGRRDHLLMVDIDQARDLPDRGSIAAELVGMNYLWDITFTQEPRQEGPGSFSVSVPLKKNVEHEAVLVHSPPQPMSDAIDTCTHLVQMPPGTSSGFPVTQVFCEQGTEFDIPLAQRLMADLDTALVQQFLHVPVT